MLHGIRFQFFKGKRSSSLQYFSDEQINFVYETAKEVMEIFGYQVRFLIIFFKFILNP
jgi:hypothetical protein